MLPALTPLSITPDFERLPDACLPKQKQRNDNSQDNGNVDEFNAIS